MYLEDYGLSYKAYFTKAKSLEKLAYYMAEYNDDRYNVVPVCLRYNSNMLYKQNVFLGALQIGVVNKKWNLSYQANTFAIIKEAIGFNEVLKNYNFDYKDNVYYTYGTYQ